jgi:acyl carrier protein
MQPVGSSHLSDPDGVLQDVVRILQDMLDEEDDFEGSVGADTLLVRDLGCSSLEIVELAVSIEDHFDAPGLPFQHLLMTPDGRYIDDLRVGDLARFVSSQIGSAPREAAR